MAARNRKQIQIEFREYDFEAYEKLKARADELDVSLQQLAITVLCRYIGYDYTRRVDAIGREPKQLKEI